MKSTKALWLLAAAAALLVMGWALRFDYVRHSDSDFHMVNRWTGKVSFVKGYHAEAVTTAESVKAGPYSVKILHEGDDELKAWEEIVADKAFIALSGEDREIVRRRFWSFFKIRIPAGDLEQAREQFDAHTTAAITKGSEPAAQPAK